MNWEILFFSIHFFYPIFIDIIILIFINLLHFNYLLFLSLIKVVGDFLHFFDFLPINTQFLICSLDFLKGGSSNHPTEWIEENREEINSSKSFRFVMDFEEFIHDYRVFVIVNNASNQIYDYQIFHVHLLFWNGMNK
jgi:hypothetical protein